MYTIWSHYFRAISGFYSGTLCLLSWFLCKVLCRHFYYSIAINEKMKLLASRWSNCSNPSHFFFLHFVSLWSIVVSRMSLMPRSWGNENEKIALHTKLKRYEMASKLSRYIKRIGRKERRREREKSQNDFIFVLFGHCRCQCYCYYIWQLFYTNPIHSPNDERNKRKFDEIT